MRKIVTFEVIHANEDQVGLHACIIAESAELKGIFEVVAIVLAIIR
jgi:hypothetical protein